MYQLSRISPTDVLASRGLTHVLIHTSTNTKVMYFENTGVAQATLELFNDPFIGEILDAYKNHYENIPSENRRELLEHLIKDNAKLGDVIALSVSILMEQRRNGSWS